MGETEVAEGVGMSLSTIIPTCGRSTLENAVASVLHQLHPEDELIIVGSRPPNIEGRWNFIKRDNRGCREDNSTKSGPRNETHGPRGTESGAVERDIGDAAAKGTHLLHLDDDDVFVKTAFDDIRAAIRLYPRQVLIFRMEYGIKNQWISPYSVDIDGVPTLGVQEYVSMGTFGGMEMVFPRVNPNPKWEQEGEMRNVAEDLFTTMRYIQTLGIGPVWPRKTIGIVRPTRGQILYHTGRDTEPLYAPQPAWSGRQDSRRRCARISELYTREQWDAMRVLQRKHGEPVFLPWDEAIKSDSQSGWNE